MHLHAPVTRGQYVVQTADADQRLSPVEQPDHQVSPLALDLESIEKPKALTLPAALALPMHTCRHLLTSRSPQLLVAPEARQSGHSPDSQHLAPQVDPHLILRPHLPVACGQFARANWPASPSAGYFQQAPQPVLEVLVILLTSLEWLLVSWTAEL